MQSATRMFLCKRQHQPRYRAVANINSMQGLLSRMHSIAQQLTDKGTSESTVKALQGDMMAAVRQIKVSVRVEIF